MLDEIQLLLTGSGAWFTRVRWMISESSSGLLVAPSTLTCCCAEAAS
jgi:hypothetical protein